MSQIVRLSVNLAPDVADVLKKWSASDQVSLTETVRRAIAVYEEVRTQIAAGNSLAVVDGDRSNYRDIVLNL